MELLHWGKKINTLVGLYWINKGRQICIREIMSGKPPRDSLKTCPGQQSLVNDARQRRQQQVVLWLDFSNAFNSITERKPHRG